MQTVDEFKVSCPGGWTDDLKCKYSEVTHTTDEAWKKSCPGGDPDVTYSYDNSRGMGEDMKDAQIRLNYNLSTC